MPPVPIAVLLANPLVDAEAHLDAGRVRSYTENPDQPPVVVFETDEGLLLADGYHRLAAARLRGAATVNAEIRSGSRQDALRYAAANGALQRGISVCEALGRIHRRSPGRSPAGEAAGGYDPVMESPPAVWTVARGADEDEAKDLLDRLADQLGIEPPEIKNGMVMLPADYPRVADALDAVQPDWRRAGILVPPVA